MKNEANMKIPKAAFPKTATSAWLQNQVNPQRQLFDNTHVLKLCGCASIFMKAKVKRNTAALSGMLVGFLWKQ